MIGKELLSEILGYTPKTIKFDKNRNEVIWLKEITYKSYGIEQSGNIKMYINIYELAHKCKKWLINSDYFITIKYDPRIGRTKIELIVSKDSTTISSEEHFYTNTEQDAIFQACEWILKQKDN